MATIEELYKAFGVLADAKENAEKVCATFTYNFSYQLFHVKSFPSTSYINLAIV